MCPSLPRSDKLFPTIGIVQKLGGGGMGVVYKAEDTTLGRFADVDALDDTLWKPNRRKREGTREAAHLPGPPGWQTLESVF